MFGEGLALGFATFMSLIFTFFNLPPPVRQWMVRHRLITDIAAGVLVFLILSGISKSIMAVIVRFLPV